MSRSAVLLGAVALSLLATAVSAAGRVEPKTEAAVLAADDEWLAAERRGDVATLDRRLADGYRDVMADGKVHVKADMLRAVANVKDKATDPAKKVAADFRAKNPIVEKVQIVGDTAILTFHSVDPAQQAIVRSMDIFTYDHGMWRGVMSVHPAVPPRSS
jgi:hypothetical protein